MKLTDLFKSRTQTFETMVLDRPAPPKLAEPPPPPPREPRERGRGDEPQGGKYWMRNGTRVPITGKANEIVNLSGQIMLLNPEAFGFSADEVMDYLTRHGEQGPHGPAAEFQKLLDGVNYDLSRTALLWKSSKLAFQMLMEQGWMRISYLPPQGISFAATPQALKRQIRAAATAFPLMQIDTILVIEVTDFDVGNGRFLNNGHNRVLRFNRDDFPGFAGTFGAMQQWSDSGQAPSHNYLYIATPASPERVARDRIQGITTSQQATIPIDTREGRKRLKRWCITGLENAPTNLPADQFLYRFPKSVAKIGWMHLAPLGRGRTAIWGEQWFDIAPKNIEVQTPEGWKPVSHAAG